MSDITALFQQLTFGVYVIEVANAGRCGGFTAAWVMQASFDPPLLVVSINPDHASYASLHSSGSFTVNVLKRGQLELARAFGTQSAREQDKLAGIRWWPGRHGAPILEEASAYFDCELSDRLPSGDHELVVGRVIEGRILSPGAVPMTYAETGDMDGSSSLYPEKF